MQKATPGKPGLRSVSMKHQAELKKAIDLIMISVFDRTYTSIQGLKNQLAKQLFKVPL